MTATIYEIAPGGTTRIATLASETASVESGSEDDTHGLDPIRRVESQPAPYHWYTIPLAASFKAGHRYEVVFSDWSVIAPDEPYDSQNWLFGAPLFDNENRALGHPYAVDDYLTVVDGSLRGSRATLLPPARLFIRE